MRRWSVWTFASTWGQGMPCHDVISGILVAAVNPYLAAFATLLLVTSIPQQTVPPSAASLSPGFLRGLCFLGNPALVSDTPDGLLPVGRHRPGLLRSQRSFVGRGWCLGYSPRPVRVASGAVEFPTPGAC